MYFLQLWRPTVRVLAWSGPGEVSSGLQGRRALRALFKGTDPIREL